MGLDQLELVVELDDSELGNIVLEFHRNILGESLEGGEVYGDYNIGVKPLGKNKTSVKFTYDASHPNAEQLTDKFREALFSYVEEVVL